MALAQSLLTPVEAASVASDFTVEEESVMAMAQMMLNAFGALYAIERPQPHNALTDCRAPIAVLMTRSVSEKRSSARRGA